MNDRPQKERQEPQDPQDRVQDSQPAQPVRPTIVWEKAERSVRVQEATAGEIRVGSAPGQPGPVIRIVSSGFGQQAGPIRMSLRQNGGSRCAA